MRRRQSASCLLSSSPTRSGWACDDWQKRDQGRALFEAIAEFARTPVFLGQRRLPVAQRRDPDCGSPFFCLLFFGEAKKSESPPGDSRPAPFRKPTK